MDTKAFIAQLKKAPTKKGCKKAGRNKVKCAFYRSNRYVKNKVRKLKLHLTVHPNDGNAVIALGKLV